MLIPTLPKYSSSENNDYHPVFKYAIEKVIMQKSLTTLYEVCGQYQSPTGPIDFVVLNKQTKKVLFPIEIKRTQSSVKGGGRRQARDYWSNLGTHCETPFYCVSNLELTEIFRNDSSRPRTISQRLNLSKEFAGLLEPQPEPEFLDNLVACLEEVFDIVLGKLPSTYQTGFTQLQDHLSSHIDDYKNWHKIFMPLCFEYIRGVASKTKNLQATPKWKSAESYKNTPFNIASLGKQIDFSLIFSDPVPTSSDQSAFINVILKEAFESGKTLGQGDDIAEIVNDILAPVSPGIVETDTELAQLLAVMARITLGRELHGDEVIMDPGSGSGRLLSALPLLSFPSISPVQIWANEIEQRFAESLSLRLGLAFSSIITPRNSPNITISAIEDINQNDFCNVKVIVMNPPFLSGVQSVERKKAFASKICEVSKKPSILDFGQIALEVLFLELVWNYAKSDTVFATVFPAQHLFRLSEEVIRLRKFLIESFKLTSIVMYPQTGLFKNVTKQTVLLIGNKDAKQDFINVIEIQKEVGNIDLGELISRFHDASEEPTHGVYLQKIDRAYFLESVEDGWINIIGSGQSASRFINSYMKGYCLIGNLRKDEFRRGSVGNSGNTELTVIKASNKYPTIIQLIPKDWMCKILNNTQDMPRILNYKSANDDSFVPPIDAYNTGTNDNLILENIVSEYLKVFTPKLGAQVKKIKTKDEIIKNLKSDQKLFGSGWAIVQRASRKYGEVGFVSDDKVLLSTNVPMIKLSSANETKLMASWLFSIFGQLQMELFATSQEGMRKLEQGNIGKISYPDFSKISSDLSSQLFIFFERDSAIEFKNIQLRETDRLWALFIEKDAPEKCLNEALMIFSNLVSERIGFGEK